MDNTKLTLVLMAGLPGAGKTTLSVELGHELGWHVINKDVYKVANLQKMEDEQARVAAYEQSFDEKDEQARAAAYERSFDEIQSIFSHQHPSIYSSVILDSSLLDPNVLKKALDLIECIGNAQLKIILLVADRDTRTDRIRKRPPQTTNIRVDPTDRNEYMHYFEHLSLAKHLELEEDLLILDTDKYSFEECLGKIVAVCQVKTKIGSQ